MNKKEIQTRVTRDGETLHQSKFKWNAKTKTFRCDLPYLVINFADIDEITVETAHECTILVGYGCTVDAQFNCTIITGDECNIRASEHCNITAGCECTIKVTRHCTVKAKVGCNIKAEDHCSFVTEYSCKFKTHRECSFKTKSYCTFDTGDYCNFSTHQECSFKTGSGCVFDAMYQCDFETGNHCVFDTGTACTFDTGSQCVFNTSMDCNFDVASSCTIIPGYSCNISAGHYCTVITDEGAVVRTDDTPVDIVIPPSNVPGRIRNGIYSETGKPAILADNILSEIIHSRRVGGYVMYVVYNYIYNGFEKKRSYLVGDGDNYAHGKTLKEAFKELKYKAEVKDLSEYNDITTDTVLTEAEAIKLYRTVTGACSYGTAGFVEGLKDKPETLTVAELIELTKCQYGNREFTKFIKEITNGDQ